MYLWWMGVAEPLIRATLLAEALDNGPVAVFVVGDDFRHIAVNQYACTSSATPARSCWRSVHASWRRSSSWMSNS